MKKLIIVFAAVFAIGLGIFTSAELDTIKLNSAIEKSPAYALVEATGMTKKTKKSRDTFKVHFTYTAGGASYPYDTDFLAESEAKALVATPNLQVAYATDNPAKAVLKSEFDKRDRDVSFMGALGKSLGFSFFLALVLTAVLAYQIPWLRR